MCFSPYLGIGCGGGRTSNGPVHYLLMQFFTVSSSKIEVFGTHFFDIVATPNYHLSYAKHVLGSIYVFFYPFWVLRVGGGGPNGLMDWYTTCFCSFSPCTPQKSKFVKLIFLTLWPLITTIQAM